MDENHKNVHNYVKINQGVLEEALNSFAKIKCQELLLLVAEKAKIKKIFCSPINGKETIELVLTCGAENTLFNIDKDSILNAVDLETLYHQSFFVQK